MSRTADKVALQEGRQKVQGTYVVMSVSTNMDDVDPGNLRSRHPRMDFRLMH
jgi:hypothetical protein